MFCAMSARYGQSRAAESPRPAALFAHALGIKNAAAAGVDATN
jgi:hypothetical protein